MKNRSKLLTRLCFGAALLAAISPVSAQAQDARAGKAKARMCTPCHGADGIAVAPNAPHIAGENAAYLSAQLKAFRDGDRQHDQMSIIARGLSDEDIANLALWFSMFEIEAHPPDLD